MPDTILLFITLWINNDKKKNLIFNSAFGSTCCNSTSSFPYGLLLLVVANQIPSFALFQLFCRLLLLLPSSSLVLVMRKSVDALDSKIFFGFLKKIC